MRDAARRRRLRSHGTPRARHGSVAGRAAHLRPRRSGARRHGCAWALRAKPPGRPLAPGSGTGLGANRIPCSEVDDGSPAAETLAAATNADRGALDELNQSDKPIILRRMSHGDCQRTSEGTATRAEARPRTWRVRQLASASPRARPGYGRWSPTTRAKTTRSWSTGVRAPGRSGGPEYPTAFGWTA